MNYLVLEPAYANRVAMRRRLLAFLVLIAVFFGGTVAPALAHSSGGSLMHASEVIDVHESDAPDSQSAFKKQTGEKDNGAAPSAAFHHHCACATVADHVAPGIDTFLGVQIFSPTLASVMPSRRSAPLTEPPSA